jgi:hypothetical protein
MQTQHSHQSSKKVTKMHQLVVPYLIKIYAPKMHESAWTCE